MEGSNTLLSTALLTFGVCGIIGVLVDIDHVIAHKRGLDHRFLHPYYLLVAGVIIFCCLTRIGGLLVQ